MTRVTITYADMIIVALAGVLRQVENLKDGRRPVYAAANPDDSQGPFQRHIEGCLGEYVVAKHLGLHWSGKGNFGEPDVAGKYQVRLSRGKCLTLHDRDKDNAIFYAVEWHGGLEFIVRGPAVARDGKKPEFWRTDVPSPAYFYPVS